MARRSEILLSVAAQVDDAVKRLQRLEKQVDNVSKSGNTAGKVFSGFKSVFGGLIGGFAAAQLASTALEMNKLGAEAIDLEVTFSRLPDAKKLFADLKASVRGTVPDLDLMRNAIQGIDLGATNEQLKVFAEFARFQSVRTGVDTLTTLGNIQGAVFRGSTELLDNFGISLAQVNGEIQALSESAGKNANALSAVERRTFLAEAVMKIMQDRMESAGAVAVTQAERNRAAAAEIENLRVRMAKIVSGAGAGFINFFGSAAGAVSGFLDLFADADRVGALSDEFVRFKKASKDQDAELQNLISTYDNLKKVTDPSAEQQAELARVIARLAALVPGAVSAIDEYGTALDINIGSVNAFAAAQRELLRVKEAGNIRNIVDTIEASSEAYDEASQRIEDYNKKVESLRGTKGVTVLEDGPGLKTSLIDAEDQIKSFQFRIAQAGEQAKKSQANFNRMVLALSSLFELSDTSPQKLSLELGVSEELAGKLIARYKTLRSEIEQTNNAGGSGGKGGGDAAAAAAEKEIQKQIEVARVKARLDALELDNTLSSLEKQKEGIRIRYEAEISEARKKSSTLAQLLEQERDRQLAILEQQQQAELDSRIKTLQESLQADQAEVSASNQKYDLLRQATRQRYEQELVAIRQAIAQKQQLLTQGANAELEIELAKLKQLEKLTGQKLSTDLKKIDFQELKGNKFKVDIEFSADPQTAIQQFDQVLASLKAFYDAQIALAGENAGLVAEIEQQKADQIQDVNDQLNSRLRESAMERLQQQLDDLDFLFAGYDTFWSNLLDTEQTGAEKRLKIINSVRDSFLGMLADMLKGRIQAALQEVTIEQTVATTKTGIAATAAAQQVAIDAAQVAASQAKTQAQTVEAASGFFKAHSGIPFVGVALALAAIATMIATLGSLKGKARGGRVKSGDLVDSPLTPSGEDGVAGLQIGEHVLTRDQVKRYEPIINLMESGASFSNFQPQRLQLPPLPPPTLPPAAFPGSVAGSAIFERTEKTNQIPVIKRVELELIEASGARVRQHYQRIEDDYLEPHRNLKNRDRRSSTGEVL